MIGMTTVDKEGRAKTGSVIFVPKDYVQVVRCKDCKHRDKCHKKISIREYDKDIKCNYAKFEKLTYCSFGERNEDGD